MKRKILFVDDDPNILDGLRDRLHRQREKWEMRFAPSGRAALELLATTPVDVIVTDMRMPEMDGATLLQLVQKQCPQTVRVVLSAHSELETALRAVPVAHQFLTKPCEPGTLETVVERACNLQLLLSDELVQRAVGRIDKLPSLPHVYAALTAALADESVTIEKVAGILKQDMAMCAKILQLVNSAFFRLARSVSQIEEAVAYLGFNAVKHLALAVEVYQASECRIAPPRLLEQLQSHALRVATLASAMFSDKRSKEDAFVAGLLHDIGKLLLVTGLPDEFAKVRNQQQPEPSAHHVAEQNVLGVSHAEIGAYLLGIWGLPYPIVEAVADHHEPRRAECKEFGILAAVHVADSIINEQSASEPHCDSPLDRDFVEALGLAARLPQWRELAKRQQA